MWTWIENELIELINSISSGFQFQFNSNSKSFNSIPIQFMLNWIELIINSNSIHELIRALFQCKMSRETSPRGQMIYIFLFCFYNLLQLVFVKCSPLFLCIESVIPTFKEIHAAVTCASWQHACATCIPDQWLDRESVRPDQSGTKPNLVSFLLYI